MKTIISKATISNDVKVNSSRDNRYIKLSKPELYTCPELTSGKNVKGIFVLLGTEKMKDFNILLRFAEISEDVNLNLYNSYVRDINSDKRSKKYKEALEARDLLLEQGFYAIVNTHAAPQKLYGSFDTKYQYGIKFDDVFCSFGVPTTKNGYTNYSEKSLGYFMSFATKSHIEKVAKANPENVKGFIDDIKQFVANNINSLSFVKETEAKIAEIKSKETHNREDYAEIDYKQLYTAKTTIATEIVELAFAYPFAGYAKSGNVKAFTL